jgi:hypothetical protein
MSSSAPPFRALGLPPGASLSITRKWDVRAVVSCQDCFMKRDWTLVWAFVLAGLAVLLLILMLYLILIR